MKKVLLASLLILALCLTLFACTAKPADEPVATEAPVVTQAPDPNSIAGKLASLGFSEKDFLVNAGDRIDFDDEGDIILYSTASYEEVAKAVYAACGKAADDGKVRDYWSEEPTDFAFDESMTTFFGYNRNGNFEYIAFSPYWTNDDGTVEYLLDWG